MLWELQLERINFQKYHSSLALASQQRIKKVKSKDADKRRSFSSSSIKLQREKSWLAWPGLAQLPHKLVRLVLKFVVDAD